MKLKYYLRGAGVGIIVCTLIWIIAGGGNTISDREVVDRAKKLGMVYPNEYSGTILSQMSSQAADEKSSQAADEKSSQAADEQSSQGAPSSSQAEASQAEPSKDSSGTENVDTVTIEVKPGMLSDVVSKELEMAGLVNNADDYNKFLISKGYDKIMCVGDNVIPRGATEEEIAQILITKKK